MPIEVKFFPQLMHLSSDGISPIVFDVATSKLIELDYVSATIVEEAVVRGAFDNTTYDAAKSVLQLRDVDYSHFEESVQLIDDLRSQGLFTNTKREVPAISASPNTYRGVILNISSACQLNCRYCIASGGDYGLTDAPPLMSYEVGKRAIDFFLELFDKSRDTYTITFFGGEPLVNWDVIVKLTYYAEDRAKEIGKDVRFIISTNAIGINEEIAKFMHDHSFRVQVSLDGNETVQETLRPLRSGSPGSYKKTIEGISFLRDYFTSIHCRATVTSLEYDVNILEKSLADAGSSSSQLSFLQAEQGDPLQLNWSSLRKYTQMFCDKVLKDSNSTLTLVQEMPWRIASGWRSSWACGFVVSAITVSTDGNIYACSRFVGDNRYLLGSVYAELDHEKANHLREKASVNSVFGCRTCWVRYLCSGGCTANNIADSSPVYFPSFHLCYLHKRLIEASIEKYLMDQKLLKESAAIPAIEDMLEIL